MSEPKVLLTDLGIPESPRWHEGRLWFCNWIERQVVAVSLDGKAEVITTRDPGSHPMGYSIDWLPDGRLLVTGDKLRRQEAGRVDGRPRRAARKRDRGGRPRQHLPQRRGLRLRGRSAAQARLHHARHPRRPGYARSPATSQFPNGMVVTPDNRTLIISESFAGRLTAFDIDADGGLSNRRVWAEGLAPDGICLDADGAVWAGTGFSVARVAEGGQVLQRVELPENRAPFALMLGGPDRRTLFILTAEWRPADGHVANLDRLANGPHTGEILTLPVSVPGVGRP